MDIEAAEISATVCGDNAEKRPFAAQSGASSHKLFDNSARGSAKRKAAEPAEQEGGQRLKK